MAAKALVTIRSRITSVETPPTYWSMATKNIPAGSSVAMTSAPSGPKATTIIHMISV